MAKRGDTLGGPRGGSRGAVSHAQASALLAGANPVIARLFELSGPMRLEGPAMTHFAALVRSIVHQQLAGSAAVAIHARLEAALGGNVTPNQVVAAAPEVLREAGLSMAKVASINDLAVKALDATVDLDPRRVARIDDEQVIRELCEVKGIGVWTAQMFLLFQLRRLDVWPTGDLGVRKGYALAFEVPQPTPAQLEILGEQFRPYRSVAAWYCWRATEVIGGRRSP